LIDLGGRELYRMAASVVGAVDEQPADAHLTHFAEGDLRVWHAGKLTGPVGWF
jgi:hypothetical protein